MIKVEVQKKEGFEMTVNVTANEPLKIDVQRMKGKVTASLYRVEEEVPFHVIEQGEKERVTLFGEDVTSEHFTGSFGEARNHVLNNEEWKRFIEVLKKVGIEYGRKRKPQIDLEFKEISADIEDHFIITSSETIRMDVSMVEDILVSYAYEGIGIDMEQEPTVMYCSDFDPEDYESGMWEHEGSDYDPADFFDLDFKKAKEQLSNDEYDILCSMIKKIESFRD